MMGTHSDYATTTSRAYNEMFVYMLCFVSAAIKTV